MIEVEKIPLMRNETQHTWVAPGPPLRAGDRLTIDGCSARRTVWQWLTRQPRRLQRFTAREDSMKRTITY